MMVPPKSSLTNSQQKPIGDFSHGASMRKEERKNEEFGKYVGVMSILMYDSINQQSAVSTGGREREGGRGPWRICSGLRMEVKLSSRTMGFCVPLCYLYLRIFKLLQLPLVLYPKNENLSCAHLLFFF